MPLVVSSLTGDASDVFDWMRMCHSWRHPGFVNAPTDAPGTLL